MDGGHEQVQGSVGGGPGLEGCLFQGPRDAVGLLIVHRSVAGSVSPGPKASREQQWEGSTA